MTTPLIYYYTDGACGTGKTFLALTQIALGGGRNLFVTDRRETMTERVEALTSMLVENGISMPVVTIMSDKDRRTKDWSVRRRVHDLPGNYRSMSDVCAFITHEAMRMCDLSGFTGWNIWIDEVPDIMDNETMNVGVSKVLLSDLYSLDPITNDDGEPSGWSAVGLKAAHVDLADIAQDDIASNLRALHSRVADQHVNGRRAVIVNATDWSEYTSDKKCNWFSVWSPEHLSAFDRVTFLGNAFTDSLTFQIMRAMWPAIEWQEIKANSIRAFKARTATIHYYADNHQTSRNLFNSDAGKANLQAMCDDVRKRVNANHIYMTNGPEDDFVSLPGRKLAPKQAGSNNYSRATAATCIYTVKPDYEQRKAYELLGVDPDYYTETNERETILQFMCRTSIRDPENDSHVDFFVYDRSQAEFLQRYFDRDERGYVRATMELHDLGFAHVERKHGRPPVVRTAEEDAEKLADRREADRLRKAAMRAAQKASAT